jgi:hypothetical protein
VDFRVLGPVKARAAGRPLPVAGARQRALLAVLLLRAGEPVSREGVIVDLWGERSPDGAVKTVQAVVAAAARARRRGGAVGQQRGRLPVAASSRTSSISAGSSGCARTGGARWRPATTSARRQGYVRRSRSGTGRRWPTCRSSRSRHPGARLQDLRAAAVEDRVEADLAMGRGAELVGELEGLVAAFASAAAIACGVEHAAADRR